MMQALLSAAEDGVESQRNKKVTNDILDVNERLEKQKDGNQFPFLKQRGAQSNRIKTTAEELTQQAGFRQDRSRVEQRENTYNILLFIDLKKVFERV